MALVDRLATGGVTQPRPLSRDWRAGVPILTPDAPFDVVWLVPPTGAGVVARHLDALLAAGARRAVYVSSTSVYGGAYEVVDFASARRPTTDRGRARVAEEDAFLARGASVVRLPGIYGPGRSIFERLGPSYTLVEGGQKLSARIHRDDVAMGLEVVLRHGDGAYLLADEEQFRVRDLVAFACDLLGRDLPPSESLADYAERRGQFAASFWVHSNTYDATAVASLPGFALKYPSFRDGLRDIYQSLIADTGDATGAPVNEEN
jgi:nucleoside-diphosphate-sugar epimerase